MRQNSGGNRQSGNIFFIILIAVMLFAALSFTFSRGIQQGGENVSRRQAELIAGDILNYAQRVERGVQRILSNRISENALSFENNFVAGYAHGGCTEDACRVFAPSGGGVAWQDAPTNANNGEPYVFVTNRVGSDDGTTRQIGTAERDLVILLPVKPSICAEINQKANGLETWESSGSPNISVLFTGSFTTALGTRIANGNSTEQPRTGCFCDGSSPCTDVMPHFFYSVILER